MSRLDRLPYHARTHLPGGSDPIPGLLSTSGSTYPDLVANHACLEHYWPCDEESGDLIDRVGDWDLARDAGPSGYPTYEAEGPLSNLPQYTAVENGGLGGIPAAEDGRFHYTIVSAPPFWTGTAPFTVELWAYLDAYDPSVSPSLLAAGSGLSIFSQRSGATSTLTASRGGVTVSDTVVLPLSEWHHIVVRYDGTDLSLWRNGVEVDSDAGGGAVTISGAFVIMNASTGPTWSPWDGRVAQVALYDCALTPTEIASHKNAQHFSDNIPAWKVLTSDGEGGFYWAYPTIEVEY